MKNRLAKWRRKTVRGFTLVEMNDTKFVKFSIKF